MDRAALDLELTRATRIRMISGGCRRRVSLTTLSSFGILAQRVENLTPGCRRRGRRVPGCTLGVDSLGLRISSMSVHAEVPA